MATITYLMSYPGPNWQIRGGENFRSEARAETNPRQAFREWLTLCDAIVRAGGHILVMPPPGTPEHASLAAAQGPASAVAAGPASGGAPAAPELTNLTGLIYTANAGQLFQSIDGWVYLVSRMAVAHRRGERAHVRAFMERAGVVVKEATHTWEGQADLQTVGGNRFIATWGVRSERESLDELRPLLPMGAKVLEVKIREPFFHGDTCLNPLTSRAGHSLLLGYDGALCDGGLVAIRTFLGDRVEVLPVDRDDALGYACNALCVNGTVFLPTGLSTTLRGHLIRRGYTYEELDLSELFGKGGGGPRCLVNELRGLVVNPGAPDYASMREELHAKMQTWPEKSTPVAAPPTPSIPSA